MRTVVLLSLLLALCSTSDDYDYYNDYYSESNDYYSEDNDYFSDVIDDFYESVSRCVSEIDSDVTCISMVCDELDNMSTTIDIAYKRIRELNETMAMLEAELDTVGAVTNITKYIPSISPAVSKLQQTINSTRGSFDEACERVKNIGNKISMYKDELDNGTYKCLHAKDVLVSLNKTCGAGMMSIYEARNCTNSLDEFLKFNLNIQFVSFGDAVNPKLSSANQDLRRIGTTCKDLKKVPDMPGEWPDISKVMYGIRDMHSALQPMLVFFQEIENILGEELCIPGSAEKVARIKRTDETTLVGRRHKRAILTRLDDRRDPITETEEQADDTYSSTSKRSDNEICFSIQRILDGDKRLQLADGVLSDLLRFLPSFDLPGMPNFDLLSDIDLDIDVPAVDFGLSPPVAFEGIIGLSWDIFDDVVNTCSMNNSNKATTWDDIILFNDGLGYYN